MNKPHKQLNLWHESMDFVELMYEMTNNFPNHEKFGLISQIRRAAISVPANIAEGAARKNSKEFIQYLHISMGSCSELGTHLELVRRLGYISNEYWLKVDSFLNKIDRMLIGLRNLISTSAKTSTPYS